MENKQFPEQEPLTPTPADMEPEIPAVMTELTFDSDPQPISMEAIADLEVPAEEVPSDSIAQEPPIVEEIPETEESTPDGEAPVNHTIEIPIQTVDFQDDLLDLDFLKEPQPSPVVPAEEPQDQAYQDRSGTFESLFNAKPKQEPVKVEVPLPSQKGRPKRKKGEGLFGIPNILVTVVWLALILVIGVTLGRMLWVCAADVLAFGREDKPVTITIYEADTMDDIVNKLHDAGLIRYKSLFNLYAGISDAEEDIKPGIYDLNTRYDYHALVNFMSPSSSRQVIKLTIPEGYTCRQIFNLLEENRICTAVDLGVYAAGGELSDYWFLEGVQRGDENSLEGYLFPDTYEFYKNSTPREALEKMLNNFDHRFSEEMRAQIDTLNANVTGGGYTVREITIIASLIEKESAIASESANISGVIYNRLFNWEYPALLNIDAAIVYAQGGEADSIDTSLDSPYNTYTHIGLTPGPIANPGLSSLQAALNPATHNYYYYVLNPETGMHKFSTTQDEHNANVAAFYH